MSARRRRIQGVLRGLLAASMMLVGVMHFAKPEPFVAIMPDYLPWHLGLVYLSGLFEVALGIALLIPRLRPLAGWGLIALLLAVWPANVWMATEGVQLPGLEVSSTAAWIRVGLQPLLFVWAWWVSRPDPDRET